MKRITPCLWFNGNAEEAAKYYVSTFKNSKIKYVTRNGEGMRMPKGTVLTVSFVLDGQEFLALNGGPEFTFTEAISFIVDCKTQKEIDTYWKKLSAGGQEIQCGWLKDKYGIAWQIVPSVIPKMLQVKDRKKIDRMMQAMMQMIKLDINALTRAFKGK